MSILSALSGLAKSTQDFIRKLLEGERKNHLQFLKEYCNDWRPNGSDGKRYVAEMRDRMLYLRGAMKNDMAIVIKNVMPKTYKEFEHIQYNFALAKYLIEDRAQSFPDSTRFRLLDRTTKKEAQDDRANQAFQYIIDNGAVLACLQDADKITQTCHRAALKWWFDDSIQCVRPSVFSPDRAWLCPNPMRYWDPYSCIAYMFEQPGFAGIDKDPRFEIWSLRDVDITTALDADGNLIFSPATIYVTDGVEEKHVNEDDENPFVDPLSGRVIVPMTWFADEVIDNIYNIGNEDLLTGNRNLNWGMTNLQNNIIMQAQGIPVFEVPDGMKVDLPKEKIISPRQAMQLPPGVSMSFVSPGLDVMQPLEFYRVAMQMEAMIRGQDPRLLQTGADSPESGRALQMRMIRSINHVKRMRPIYKPHVENALHKGVIVWNYYAEHYGFDKIDLDKYKPTVTFGDISVPVDPTELADRHEREIEAGVSTPYHWYAEKNNCSLAEAEEAVNRNIDAINQVRAMLRSNTLSDIVTSSELPAADKAEVEAVSDTKSEREYNVYQMVKAIEMGAATPAELRKLLYPNESSGQAEAAVKRNLVYNKKLARDIAGVKQVEQQILGTTKKAE